MPFPSRRPPPVLLVALAVLALFAGWLSADAKSAAPSPYLLDLHLHGSLSERTGTMSNHTHEAEALGYDGLWWTDHMERSFARLFVHRVRFEGSLTGEARSGQSAPNGSFVISETQPGQATLEFRGDQPPEGASYARFGLHASHDSIWQSSSLDYLAVQYSQRVSLLAEPHVRLHLRISRNRGQAGALIRAELSSQSDGATRDGIPYVLEYYAPGGDLPAPGVNVARLPLTNMPANGWGEADLDLAADAATAWPSIADLGLRDVHLRLYARSGGELELDLDDFRMELAGPTDLALFRRQRDFLRSRLSSVIFHEVGMEIAGPEHLIYGGSGREDHMVALFPGDIPELLYLTPDNPESYSYPQSGIDWIHAHGGVAVLSHVFGPVLPPEQITSEEAQSLAQRVVAKRAWGADALEVGYALRGRPLADHVKVWDNLSAQGVYVTGVGVSDNHSVQPWPLGVNRMGSWLRAPSSIAADLCAAVKAGDVFFGDPVRFSPAGDFILDEASGSFMMGDVVPTAPRTARFRVRVDGARVGDHFVLLRNGLEIGRAPPLTGSIGIAVLPLTVSDGDWVRAELRGPGEEQILFTNPIYFVGPGEQIPPHRRPQ